MGTRRKHVRNSDEPIPIANPGDLASSKTLWLFTFGAYGETSLWVWSDEQESAFEIAVEWLDDHAPGHLVSLTEDDLKAAASDLGIEWDESWPDYDDAAFQEVVESAEADLTMIGHTTLTHGQYVASHEWTMGEVLNDEFRADAAVESFEEDGADMLNIDHRAEGPEKDEPTNGLHVERNGGYIDITEWTDMYAATGEPEHEGDVLRQDARVDIYELLDPKGKHRGTYSGDRDAPGLGEVLLMDDSEQEDAVVAASIAYLGYFGGEETHVSYVGE